MWQNGHLEGTWSLREEAIYFEAQEKVNNKVLSV